MMKCHQPKKTGLLQLGWEKMNMRKLIALILILLSSFQVEAAHITGGELIYEWLGFATQGNVRGSNYRITLRLFRDCDAFGPNVAELPLAAEIGIFNSATNGKVTGFAADRVSVTRLRLSTLPECLRNPPNVCYDVGLYQRDVFLPEILPGYTIVYQTCCRISSISNIFDDGLSASRAPGATYTANIPGRAVLGADSNSSPIFPLNDTSLVCRGRRFSLNMGGFDKDGDSLSYEFVSAYGSGNKLDAAEIQPAAPPYEFINYRPGFTGGSPLGSEVTINPTTGIISGIAPSGGLINAVGTSFFVVGVVIKEWRDNRLINIHRKDFILKVANCDFPQASLPPIASSCDDLTFSFSNLTPSSLINNYFWDFGASIGNSNSATPNFTFPAPGQYPVKLVVNRGEACSDSTTMLVNVFPGFTPDFEIIDACVERPVEFRDRTSAAFGVVNSWRWNFGDLNTIADTAIIQNPSYQYGTSGSKNVRLIVTSSVGCVDTLIQPFNLLDRPELDLAFRDTLICSIDDLRLQAFGQGNFSWTPNRDIINPNSPNPIVSPNDTTTYVVTLEFRGCTNTDSVKVNVIEEVSLSLMPDTTICLTDSVRIRAQSNGLQFQWTPGETLNNSTILSPFATPTEVSTTYFVRATVGRCFTEDQVEIRTSPYPEIEAGPDHTICSDSTLQLIGTTDGDVFLWTPNTGLSNPNVRNPTVRPTQTTEYYFISRFLTGACRKPIFDTVLVTVIPPVPAYAGEDTAIVIGQPLQLTASGGTFYEWTPSQFLNNSRAFDPVALLNNDQTFVVRVSTPEGCFALDTVSVRMFFTPATIFVPNAFTPNGDGQNDYFKPIPVGITEIEYFHVFNRWGEMVYSSPDTKIGWDGKYKGVDQNTGTFVWMAKATDYTGKTVFLKGTVSLIR